MKCFFQFLVGLLFGLVLAPVLGVIIFVLTIFMMPVTCYSARSWPWEQTAIKAFIKMMGN